MLLLITLYHRLKLPDRRKLKFVDIPTRFFDMNYSFKYTSHSY